MKMLYIFILGLLAIATAHNGSPLIPFCRKHFAMQVLRVGVLDQEDNTVRLEERVVIFGGKGKNYVTPQNASYLNDMWALHVTNTGFKWAPIMDNPANDKYPEGRWKMASDVYGRDQMYIYGGDDENTGLPTFLDDLWRFSAVSGNASVSYWKQRTPPADTHTGNGPGTVRSLDMYITPNGTMVAQGGKTGEADDGTCVTFTHTLDLNKKNPNWVPGADFPSFCRWGHTLTTVQSLALNKQFEVGDLYRTHGVLFGGRTHDDAGYHYFNELWAYDSDAVVWRALKLSGEGDLMPPARDHHHAAYVPEVGKLFIFGGRYSDEMIPALGDFWAFDFETRQWEDLSGPTKSVLHGTLQTPLPRFGHNMAVWRGGAGDGNPTIIFFGGEFIDPFGQKTLLNDIWLYTISTKTWREVSVSDCRPMATGVRVVPLVEMNFMLWTAGFFFVGGMILCTRHLIKRRVTKQYVSLI